jgi:hypothetical protein
VLCDGLCILQAICGTTPSPLSRETTPAATANTQTAMKRITAGTVTNDRDQTAETKESVQVRQTNDLSDCDGKHTTVSFMRECTAE